MGSFKKISCFLIVAAAFFINGCGGIGSSAHVSNFDMEISEAPEVTGATRYLRSKTSTMRLHGTFKLDPHEDSYASGKYNALPSAWSFKSENYDADGVYHLGGNEFVGGIDFYHKFHDMLIGIGASINDGLFHYFTVGYNDEFFELGAFVGVFHQMMHIRCEGSRYTEKDDLSNSLFFGFYIATYYKDFFFSYSLSDYKPSFNVANTSVETSAVVSNYFTIGYYLNKRISVTVGAISTSSDSMHLAASFGLNFYPL